MKNYRENGVLPNGEVARSFILFSVLCYELNMFVLILIFFICVFSIHRMFIMPNIFYKHTY